MQKTTYEDYKYCMQDVGNLYLGTKYTLGEILAKEDITFKFRLITERYLLPESDREDTLETHLYYLDEKSFLVQIYKQLKAKVKINIIGEKKTITGKRKKEYTTKVLPIEKLVQMTPAQKEEKGVVITELCLSKLALMAF